MYHPQYISLVTAITMSDLFFGGELGSVLPSYLNPLEQRAYAATHQRARRDVEEVLQKPLSEVKVSTFEDALHAASQRLKAGLIEPTTLADALTVL